MDSSSTQAQLTYCDNDECTEYAAPGRDYCLHCLPSFENTSCTPDNQSDGYAAKLDPEDHISMLRDCLSEFHKWYDDLFDLGVETKPWTFDELSAEWMDFSKYLNLPEHERDAFFHRVPEKPIYRNRRYTKSGVMFLPVDPAIKFQETKPGSLEISIDENSIAERTQRAPPPQMQTHDFKLNSVVEVFGLDGDLANWNGRAGFVSYENEIMENGTPCVEVNFGPDGKRAVPRDKVRVADSIPLFQKTEEKYLTWKSALGRKVNSVCEHSWCSPEFCGIIPSRVQCPLVSKREPTEEEKQRNARMGKVTQKFLAARTRTKRASQKEKSEQ